MKRLASVILWGNIFLVCGSVNSLAADPQEFVRMIQAKGELVKETIERYHEEGRDISSALASAKKVKTLADKGRLGEANTLLDEIIVLLYQIKMAEPTLGILPQVGGSFRNPKIVEIVGYDSHSMEPFISRDGKYLFFNNLNDPNSNTNLYYAERINDRKFRFKGEVKGVNTPALEAVASMDKDGNFYFVSTRSYDENLLSLFRGNFRAGKVTDVKPVEGISWRKRGWLNMDAEISADGQTLYYTQSLFDGGHIPVKSNIFVARNEGREFVPYPMSNNFTNVLNSASLEYAPSTSIDETEIYITRAEGGGGLASFKILRAMRPNRNQPFDKVEVLYNFEGIIEAPSISSNGRLLYYHKFEKEMFRIFMMEREL